MLSCWLSFFCCFVASLPLGCQGNHHRGSAVDSSSFDHDIYPHHSIIHSLLHRFQGHQTANDLPQSITDICSSNSWIPIFLSVHFPTLWNWSVKPKSTLALQYRWIYSDWPATPRKFALPIYYPAHAITPGYLYHPSHGPAAFLVHKTDGNGRTQQTGSDTGLGKVNQQETAVHYPAVNHPPAHHYFQRKSLLPIARLIFKPLDLIVW